MRARVLRTRAEDQQAATRPDIETVFSELDGTRLIEIVDVDGDLHVLVCEHNQVRLFGAGRAEAAACELSYAGFGLAGWRTPAGRTTVRTRSGRWRRPARGWSPCCSDRPAAISVMARS